AHLPFLASDKAHVLQDNPCTDVCGRAKTCTSTAVAGKTAGLRNRWAGYDGKSKPMGLGDEYQRICPAKTSLNRWDAGSDCKIGLAGQHRLIGESRRHVDRTALDPLPFEQVQFLRDPERRERTRQRAITYFNLQRLCFGCS